MLSRSGVTFAVMPIMGAREASAVLMIVAVAAHTCGAFGLKYCILKVGYYEPILPKARILGKHV